jgi:hypothetical protein
MRNRDGSIDEDKIIQRLRKKGIKENLSTIYKEVLVLEKEELEAYSDTTIWGTSKYLITVTFVLFVAYCLVENMPLRLSEEYLFLHGFETANAKITKKWDGEREDWRGNTFDVHGFDYTFSVSKKGSGASYVGTEWGNPSQQEEKDGIIIEYLYQNPSVNRVSGYGCGGWVDFWEEVVIRMAIWGISLYVVFMILKPLARSFALKYSYPKGAWDRIPYWHS